MNPLNMTRAVTMMDRFDGWFFKEEAKLLYEATLEAVRRSDAAVVEIGSFLGRSTTILGHAALSARPGAKVYAIDPHKGQTSSGQVPETFETFMRNMMLAGLTETVEQIRKKSTEVSWTRPIAVLLIDGLHDYASVEADYTHFAHFVEPGGIVAFHDYSNPDHPAVKQFVDHVVACGGLEVVSLPKKPSREASLIITKRPVTFSVIIPTISRDTLKRTLESLIVGGIGQYDEVIVVGDGPQPTAEMIVDSFRGSMPLLYIEGTKTGAFGGRQRNIGMSIAKGTHLMFIDDDDERVPESIEWAREAAEENPGKFILFKEEERRKKPTWGKVWREKLVELGNVGTQMIVVPNKKQYLGSWPDHVGSDYGFIRSTLDLWPGGDAEVVWINRVVAYLY